MASIDLHLKKIDRSYCPGDIVSGVLVVRSKSPISHQGITLTMEGTISLCKNMRKEGLFDALVNTQDPLALLNLQTELSPPGTLPDGDVEIPFEIPLENDALFDTYHGVFVNIQYVLTCQVLRGRLAKNLKRSIEFIVVIPASRQYPARPFDFEITPACIRNMRKEQIQAVPEFRVTGRLNSRLCNLNEPFEGELTVVRSDAPIKSIELQLVRVETVGKDSPPEATEIQNIQLAEGDILREQMIPIYMIFPRLFTCPTVKSDIFKVDFEVNLAVLFQDSTLVSENFPLVLFRGEPSRESWLASASSGF
eukprot:gnl/Trimastix_PCT/1724.p1 GENE.gnl/Trimastix_PCT/1724~~gnl/Trimastix_PCT/1724.p1  ORF type:complete len:308 (+),score=62.40 gnl/Trimastix_PCT/1724:29-952(+)